MTTYVLELRSTANWQDVRYREYTTSAKKAELFKEVPRISFTDSGHGIVPHVREHSGHREPRNMLLADHVRDYITSKGREVKPATTPMVPKGMKPVYVKQWRTLILVPISIADEIRDALSTVTRPHCPTPATGE